MEGSLEDLVDGVIGKRRQRDDNAPGQERAVDGEARVLRRCADKPDNAVFDTREQYILLRLGEPMDLVDEDDRWCAVCVQVMLRVGEDFSNVGHFGRCC